MKTRAREEENRWPSLLLVGVEVGVVVAWVRVEVVRVLVLTEEVTLLETSLETGVEEAALVVDLVEDLVDETEPVLEAEPVPT
jgi:hypothetical protein